jgi:hypothetical protein
VHEYDTINEADCQPTVAGDGWMVRRSWEARWKSRMEAWRRRAEVEFWFGGALALSVLYVPVQAHDVS